jgi:hypothetical protein
MAALFQFGTNTHGSPFSLRIYQIAETYLSIPRLKLHPIECAQRNERPKKRCEDDGNAKEVMTRACRWITPEAGLGLEKLGHAIEYLTDTAIERVVKGADLSGEEGTFAAIGILKGLNRQIYLMCPERLTFSATALRECRSLMRFFSEDFKEPAE